MAKCNKCDENDTHESFEKCMECIQRALNRPEVIINDILTYINSYRGACEKSNLFNACLKSFNEEDIATAKAAIYNEFGKTLREPPKRNGSAKKSKKEFNLEDILEAFYTLDDKSISVVCASSNIKSIPRYNPEELDHSSMLERIIALEGKVQNHNLRLDENYGRITENKSLIEAADKSLTHVKNEVLTSIKLASESKECLPRPNSDVKGTKNGNDDDKIPTYSSVAGGENRYGGSNIVHNVGIRDTGTSATGDTLNDTHGRTNDNVNNERHPGSRGRYYGNNRDDRYHNRYYNNGYDRGYNSNGSYNRKPSRYGTTKVRDAFGVPLPSRYVVVERIAPEKTNQDIYDYIKKKNHNIPLRTIKCMSKPGSYFKRFLIEVSYEHFNLVRNEDFWPELVRVRVFKGNGKLWECTETLENQSEDASELPENLEDY